MIVTLAMRRADDMARKQAAAASACAALSDYAQANGGLFAVFGSFARGDFGPDSDLDILVAFPDGSDRDACRAAEAICHRVGLRPDVHLGSDASEGLLMRVRRDGRVLSGAAAP